MITPASIGQDGFFRGSELPRFLILSTVLAAGVVFALSYSKSNEPRVNINVNANANNDNLLDRNINIPVAARDNHPSFKTVEDRDRVTHRDYAAYRYLIEKARVQKPEDWQAQASRSVQFVNLWDRPDRYRGVPIHLEGIAMRYLTQPEIDYADNKMLHEVWMRTAESSPNPYCVVFESLPNGFPKGPQIEEDVVFDGYFLKILAYEARDRSRGAPLLVGRLTWKNKAKANGNGNGNGEALQPNWWSGPYAWLYALVSAIMLYSVIRLIFQFRLFAKVAASLVGSKTSSVTAPRRLGLGAKDSVSPEELQSWLDQASRDQEPEAPSQGKPV